MVDLDIVEDAVIRWSNKKIVLDFQKSLEKFGIALHNLSEALTFNGKDVSSCADSR